jgi:aerobic-type carbon monoxide dehydrogenase small subunit (CoxS/CutS family)
MMPFIRRNAMPDHREDRPHESVATPRPGGVSRRSFIQTVGVSSAAAALQARAGAQTGADAPSSGAPILGPGPIDVSLKVNGKAVNASIEPDASLLDLLRLKLDLTGSKEICGRGSCGGCSVILDGKLVCSCLMPAGDAHGAEVTTVEGLSRGDELDPVQEAFVRHDGLQCGYCTPGFVVASRALLNQTARPSLEEIRCGLSGNYCRCAAYVNMYNAVLEASGQDPIMDGETA